MAFSNYHHLAVVLKGLKSDRANEFLARLDRSESKNLRIAMHSTRANAANLYTALMRLKNAPNGGGVATDRSEDFSSRSEPSVDADRSFKFLKSYSVDFLKQLILGESRRNAAIIVAKLPTEFSATILRQITPEIRSEIIRSVAGLGNATVSEVENLRIALQVRIEPPARSITPSAKRPSADQPVNQTAPETVQPKASAVGKVPAVSPDTVRTTGSETISGAPAEMEAKQDPDADLLQRQRDVILRIAALPARAAKDVLINIDKYKLMKALKTCTLEVQQQILALLTDQIRQPQRDQTIRVDSKHDRHRSSNLPRETFGAGETVRSEAPAN